MAVRRSSAPVTSDYEEEVEDVVEEENEDEVPTRSSTIQAGWASAKKLQAEVSDGYINEMKLSEEDQVIKFLEEEPFAVYKQHFINETPKGSKKSFVCLEDGCPLCEDLLSKPDRKYSFNVLNLSNESGPTHMALTVGPRLLGPIQKIHEGRLGPINKNYVVVSRSGKGTSTTYNVQSLKEADVSEDYGIDTGAIAPAIKSAKLYTKDSVQVSTRAQLVEVVESVS